MTLDELIQEVYIITNRSDLVNETKSAVKAATLKAHKLDYFDRDLEEAGISFEESCYRQCLPLSTLTNFRAFKYFKRVTDEYDEVGNILTFISVDEVLDRYGVNRADICYLAGSSLEIRAATNFDKALVGYYSLPNVTDLGYSSWIADSYSYSIIYEAARVVFKLIAYDEQAVTFGQLAREAQVELVNSNILPIGY